MNWKLNFLFAIIAVALLSSCSSPKKQDGTVSDSTSTGSHSASVEKELAELRQDSIDASQITGYSVEKISGTHKYSGTTDIKYKSLAQLIKETTTESEKEMWTKEDLDKRISFLRNSSVGGRISLFVERRTLEAAKTNRYTVIIRDLEENEIFRKKFESTVTPEMPGVVSDDWWNADYCDIEKKIKAPFYVYIVESGQDAPFKFKVTAMKQTIENTVQSNVEQTKTESTFFEGNLYESPKSKGKEGRISKNHPLVKFVTEKGDTYIRAKINNGSAEYLDEGMYMLDGFYISYGYEEETSLFARHPKDGCSFFENIYYDKDDNILILE